ncbi:hypothetical protein [Nocardia brevicatena]|uniref:hypothetical protein n=1 Tax=Nocardia brevicatena TaxID=37327 RepID=UPI001C3F2FA2|nr:hypothetical protein [Nocardia brevicatena]
MTADGKAAPTTYVAALDELDRLTDEISTVCSTLSRQTTEELMAESDDEVRPEALMRPVRDLP